MWIIGRDRKGSGLAIRRSSVMQEYEKLRELVEAAADDVAKAVGGNKAAGTRVRKSMQDIKETAQSVRKKILEVRSTTPATET
jgi:predicted  nucleic acid-binding Zn-ribbon protein